MAKAFYEFSDAKIHVYRCGKSIEYVSGYEDLSERDLLQAVASDIKYSMERAVKNLWDLYENCYFDPSLYTSSLVACLELWTGDEFYVKVTGVQIETL